MAAETAKPGRITKPDVDAHAAGTKSTDFKRLQPGHRHAQSHIGSTRMVGIGRSTLDSRDALAESLARKAYVKAFFPGDGSDLIPATVGYERLARIVYRTSPD